MDAALSVFDPKAALTDDERDEVELVLSCAAQWERGELDWVEAARMGSLHYHQSRGYGPSSAYTRYVALRITPKSDPRRAALLKLCTHLIHQTRLIVTPSGVFHPHDFTEITDAYVR